MDRVPDRPHLLGHWIVLSVCLGIVCAALFLSPVKAGGSHLSLFSFLVPDTCIFKKLTGIPCPGCGLTRSIVAAAHGEIRESFLHHHLGLLTLVYILLQLVYRAGWILAPVATTRLFRGEKNLNRGMAILGVLFILNWVFTLLA